MGRSVSSGRILPVLLILLILAGCADKGPQTLPLTATEEEAARRLLAGFEAMPRPEAMDADVRLTWNLLAGQGGTAGSLQLQQPALLRFSANDPLGRPLLIAVSDGRRFTLIDNRAGHVAQGTTESDLWHRYVPAALTPDELFFFLGGFWPPITGRQMTVRRDTEGAGFWYDWEDELSRRHQVLLDPASMTMHRHRLYDSRDRLLLDLVYTDFRQLPDGYFRWPGLVEASGEAVSGSVSLRLEKIYALSPMNTATFQLTPPPHFTVEQVP